MRTREAFRRAIDRGAPSKDEAARDLEDVFARVDRARVPFIARAVPIAAGAGFAAAAAAAIVLRTTAPEAPRHVAPPASTNATTAVAAEERRHVEIYVKRSGEREDEALSLHFDLPGDPRP